MVQGCMAGKGTHSLPGGTLGCQECMSPLRVMRKAAIRLCRLGGGVGVGGLVHALSFQRQDQGCESSVSLRLTRSQPRHLLPPIHLSPQPILAQGQLP